jgi:hypothetical protein
LSASGQGQRRPLCVCAVNQVRPQPAPSDVIPIEKPRGPTVRKPDLLAATLRYGFAENDAQAASHAH